MSTTEIGEQRLLLYEDELTEFAEWARLEGWDCHWKTREDTPPFGLSLRNPLGLIANFYVELQSKNYEVSCIGSLAILLAARYLAEKYSHPLV